LSLHIVHILGFIIVSPLYPLNHHSIPSNPLKEKTPFSSGLEPPVARHHFQGLWYCGGASGSSTGSVECSSVAGVQPGTVADAQRTVAPLWMTVGMMMGLQLVEWEN
jgi:hypothetical protein